MTWLALLCVWVCAGCFFYDSNWGAAKASQKRVAAKRMPSELRGQGETTAAELKQARRLRLRAYATPHYASALVDGEQQFRQALADANPTLAHDLSFQLELTAYSVWSRATSDDDLGQLVELLQKEDPAQDVDWVVVLASPREMVATSADQLGLGQYLGRHLAIRAMSDAAEFDTIQQGYSELSEDEKRRLYAARKKHKAAAVLLHELGHTLGLPHELERNSLMSATYSKDARAFSGHARGLGRRGLELRETTLGSELHRNAAQAALNVLHAAPPHTWEASSAGQLRQLLEQHAQAPAIVQVPKHLAPKPNATPRAALPPPPELSSGDREMLARAEREQAAGRVAEARALAMPLFAKYPKVYAVQELRCQLAMKAGLGMDEERAECAPLMQLSGAPF